MESARAIRRHAAVQGGALKNGAISLVYFACGVLVSRGAVLGTLAPFGASYAAAVPKERLIPALIGSAMGYVILNPTDSFRYIAVMIAIGGVRWLVSDLKAIRQSRLFPPLAAFIPIFATGVALLFGSTSTMSQFASCIIEATLAGAAAYFFSVSVRLAGDKRSLAAFTGQETACLVMTGCVLMLALGGLAIERVSFGRILAVIAVLLCARFGGVQGGSVSGIATGAVFSLANFEQGFICGGYAFGGLMAGLFAGVGKIACALAFMLANSMMSLAFGTGEIPAAVFIESLIGSVIFLFIPKDAGNFISPVFVREPSAALGDTVKNNVILRLSAASRAIVNIKGDVDRVSKHMEELYAPSFDSVCEGGVTKDDFFRLEEYLAAKGSVEERDLEKAFVKSCCKKGEIADAMTRHYRLLTASREAQRRVAEIRGAVAGQFAGVSDVLSDLSREFENSLRCDSEAADRVIDNLSQLGAIPQKAICLIGDNGRMRVELELSGKGTPLKAGQISREVGKACGRRFDLPTLSEECGVIRAALCELPVYDLEIGSDQHIANHGKLCGDCLDYFNDGMGSTYALICDGMGTGGRAAVDGNMAVSSMGRLLRAGMTPDSALQIVNAALMIKSEDESLSTVDLASVDLYSGMLTLKKAGAAATYIRRGGRVTMREMPSLPAGILNNIQFATDTVKLSEGDMVVMISDGAVTGDDKWLERLIRTWRNGSAQELARAVVEESMRRSEGSREDDITAVAMRVVENEP